jgi:hypothetical protein
MTRKMTLMTLWIGVLCGCASSPTLSPIREGESVAIVVAMSPRSDGEIKLHNLSIGSNAINGAGSGAVIGGLYGLVCGPLAPVCVPLTASFGALAGTGTGAAIGMTGALVDENVAQLRDRLGRWRQTHDMLGELRINVTERGRKHWKLMPDATVPVVSVELQDMLLNTTRDSRVQLVFRVLVRVGPAGDSTSRTSSQKLYEYVGPLTPLSVWLDEEGDFIDTSYTSAIHQVATQIVSELAAK